MHRVATVFLFIAMTVTLANAHTVDEVIGNWQGALSAGGVELRLVIKLSIQNEILMAKIDSPDQGVTDIPVEKSTFENDTLRLLVTGIGGTYIGVANADLSAIDGTWSQAGGEFALVLERTGEVPGAERPQDPKQPFPYNEQNVAYPSKAGGVTIAGTLTWPKSEGPFPAVLLISGSGPQNRDEELMGHRPFLVLSDYLTRSGIAVLRVDDRGVGESTGDFATATTEDFALDAAAGVEFLKQREEVQAGRIGMIGHSEGAMIAPMVAGQSSDVAFVVLMAGPGVNGSEIILLQTRLISEAEGMSAEDIAKDTVTRRRMFDVITTESDEAAAATKLRAVMEEEYAKLTPEERASVGDAETFISAQVTQLTTPWMRFFLRYDPVDALAALKCPVLVINGSLDLQVSPGQNLGPIEAALRAGGNDNFVVKELPGLNHLFQAAATGSPLEYGQITETMAPLALETITTWVLEVVGGKNGGSN